MSTSDDAQGASASDARFANDDDAAAALATPPANNASAPSDAQGTSHIILPQSTQQPAMHPSQREYHHPPSQSRHLPPSQPHSAAGMPPSANINNSQASTITTNTNCGVDPRPPGAVAAFPSNPPSKSFASRKSTPQQLTKIPPAKAKQSYKSPIREKTSGSSMGLSASGMAVLGLSPPASANPVRKIPPGTPAGQSPKRKERLPPPPRRQNASTIDEIINEANDLLQAAHEAQCLGRLRNASSYLLLAHARLVGLGRRFDRSRCENGAEGSQLQQQHQQQQQQQQQQHHILPPFSTAAHNTLPDVAMMEHLAQAAMQLHHKRTGRGMQHDAQQERNQQKSEWEKFIAAAKSNHKEEVTPSKKKGGRGKKPPTLVMHTMIGATSDARQMMCMFEGPPVAVKKEGGVEEGKL